MHVVNFVVLIICSLVIMLMISELLARVSITEVKNNFILSGKNEWMPVCRLR